ncbi:Der1-like family-domain-containing protein [Pavlovales sp. CCMP2436]|nr:Der1-like family-domain-containing protein [Pavlovales sp. CCMP2436]
MIEHWYYDVPPVTRTYVTLCFLTTSACALDLVSPLSLYFNARAICTRGQFWRLGTNFLYFGPFGLDLLFHMFFLVRYSRLLEEGSFRMRTADFLYMLLVGAAVMTLAGPLLNVQFFGSSLTFMMVYVWARRNDSVRMSFLGLFQFTAPYLPWVLLSFSVLIGNTYTVDTIGIAVGHVYFFLEDIYPRMPAARGRRLLKTPRVLEMLCNYAFSAPQGGYDFQFDALREDDINAAAAAGDDR